LTGTNTNASTAGSGGAPTPPNNGQ
jgi:hypothetical protein